MGAANTPTTPTAPKLMDQVTERLRTKHDSIRAEKQYVQWIRRYIFFHGKRHPREMGATEVEAFLTQWLWTGMLLLRRKIKLWQHYCFSTRKY